MFIHFSSNNVIICKTVHRNSIRVQKIKLYYSKIRILRERIFYSVNFGNNLI